MPINNFVEDFMRGLQQGQQQKQAKQAEIERAEDRKLEKMLLQHKLRELTIAEKVQARGLAKDNFSLFEGRPASEFPVSGMNAQGASPSGLPGGIPNLTPQRAPQPMTIPGVEELGVGDVQMTPRTMEDMLKAQAQAKLNEPFNLAPGARRFHGGQVVAENPAAPRPANLQTIETVIGGQPTMATFNPQTGEVKPIAGARPYDPPRRTGAGTGTGTPPSTQGDATMDGLANMVLANPDTLKQLPAKDRGLVMRHIAASGGEMPNKRREAVNTMVDGALGTLADLGLSPNEAKPDDPNFVAPEGFSGAVGAKGITSLFGLKSTPVAGSDAAGIAAKIEALRAQITLPQLEFLKGLGAMSDREFATIQASVTALNRDMSESAFVAELKKIYNALNTAKARINAGASLQSQSTVQIGAPRSVGGFTVEIVK